MCKKENNVRCSIRKTPKVVCTCRHLIFLLIYTTVSLHIVAIDSMADFTQFQILLCQNDCYLVMCVEYMLEARILEELVKKCDVLLVFYCPKSTLYVTEGSEQIFYTYKRSIRNNATKLLQ